jgi:membrane-bound ClpP family serine protease
MSITGIIILLFVALLLIVLEIFVLPGVGIAGIGGIVLLIAGIYLSYTKIGVPTAHYILAGTLLLGITIMIFGLRSSTWRKLSLNTAVEGKVGSNIDTDSVKIGDTGTTVTSLRPMGTILIKGRTYEAKANNIIAAQTDIEVADINNNEIIVIPLK